MEPCIARNPGADARWLASQVRNPRRSLKPSGAAPRAPEAFKAGFYPRMVYPRQWVPHSVNQSAVSYNLVDLRSKSKKVEVAVPASRAIISQGQMAEAPERCIAPRYGSPGSECYRTN